MLRITLPTRKPGEQVVGGILFQGGVADVPALGPNARAFFAMRGATFEGLAEVEDPDGSTPTLLSSRVLDVLDDAGKRADDGLASGGILAPGTFERWAEAESTSETYLPAYVVPLTPDEE